MSAGVPPVVRPGHDLVRKLKHFPAETAAMEIVTQIRKFWEPQMRHELLPRIRGWRDHASPLLVAAAGDLVAGPLQPRQIALHVHPHARTLDKQGLPECRIGPAGRPPRYRTNLVAEARPATPSQRPGRYMPSCQQTLFGGEVAEYPKDCSVTVQSIFLTQRQFTR